MGFWSGVKKTTGFVFNFKVGQWLDYDTIKGGAFYFFNLMKSFYKVNSGYGYAETFEEAKDRLQLSDQEVELQSKNYLLVSLLFLLACIALLCYTTYLIYHAHRLSAALTAALSVYALSLSIRHHFWYYQMHERRLGCTLGEWFRALFQKSKSHNQEPNQIICVENEARSGNNGNEIQGLNKYQALYTDNMENSETEKDQ